ncbi:MULTISPECIES: hypothetical protein [Acinetobacter]|uniref:Uncharacterized protein n=1 Tax=Acinetobacter higginsii TaxID=70347 RepID=N9SV04_9GAMM|nr:MULTISPECIES: hypothetical protein [Acinetobacter]ENX58521.1 hypothetical protein F902_02922 [Acinetobacter higginsii]
MKKYELINKSFLALLIFIVPLSLIYISSNSIFYLFFFLFFGVVFTFLGRASLDRSGQEYFMYVILNAAVLLFFCVFTLILSLKNYAIFIFLPLFVYFILDYIFFEIKLKKILMDFLKEDCLVSDNNYDDFSSDFELKHGKVWGVGLGMFTIVYVIYMFVVGPYFFIFKFKNYFDVDNIVMGWKVGFIVYALVLLLLILWEYTFKRLIFFKRLLSD